MGGKPTVVVAEDDRELRELIQYTLESAAYEVEPFGAGDDCWNRLETGAPPDLVVLDIGLPGMDGVDIFERIRADDRLAKLPVVVLSGRDPGSDGTPGIGDDIDEYVTKPFSPSDLQDRIAELL